jgi:3-hydroxyisobutyrate dehydrogenase-like beta-hydroxyacid dehydrogenase
MNNTKIGFVGLGNVSGKLAGSLARHGVDHRGRQPPNERKGLK